jgi:hypothetical protein
VESPPDRLRDEIDDVREGLGATLEAIGIGSPPRAPEQPQRSPTASMTPPRLSVIEPRATRWPRGLLAFAGNFSPPACCRPPSASVT